MSCIQKLFSQSYRFQELLEARVGGREETANSQLGRGAASVDDGRRQLAHHLGVDTDDSRDSVPRLGPPENRNPPSAALPGSPAFSYNFPLRA